jgi:hypothetical protein
MLGPLFSAAVVAVFTVFILAGREDLRDRFIRLVGGRRLIAMTRAPIFELLSASGNSKET